MKTNQEKRQHIVLSENQMKIVYGESEFHSEEKTTVCIVCGDQLTDDNLVSGKPDYTYLCPICGTMKTISGED